MATWEDGPEYAPLEPPELFTLPDVAPLDSAPPPVEHPVAPAGRPGFGDPDRPVAPLAALEPATGEEPRDPTAPFDVGSDTVTQGGSNTGAWGAAHWRTPTAAAGTSAQPWGAPGGPPVTVGTSTATAGASGVGGAFPAPGTPGWFGPGPVDRVPPQPPPSLWKATPAGAIIVLAVSVLVWLAPFTFVIAFALSTRARYARRKIMTAFGVVAGFVLLVPTVGAILNYGDLSSWYANLRGWALFGSLLMIVLILVMVNGELKQGPRGPGGGPGSYPGPVGPASYPAPRTYSDTPAGPGPDRLTRPPR